MGFNSAFKGLNLVFDRRYYKTRKDLGGGSTPRRTDRAVRSKMGSINQNVNKWRAFLKTAMNGQVAKIVGILMAISETIRF
jgi:hypothetical protein